MKLDYLKDKKDFVTMVLLGASAFLGIVILIKVTGFFVASPSAKRMVEKAVTQSKLDPNDVEKYFAKSKAIVDELKKKNLFVPPPPKQKPVVSGILGDEALIKGKWYKVGDKVGDSKIVAIEAAQVRIEWEGKEIVLAPIQAPSSPSSGAPVRTKADVKEARESKTEPKKERLERRSMPRREGR